MPLVFPQRGAHPTDQLLVLLAEDAQRVQMFQAMTLWDLLEALHQVFQLFIDVKGFRAGWGLAGRAEGGAILILTLGGASQAALAESVSTFRCDRCSEELETKLTGEVVLHALHELGVRHSADQEGTGDLHCAGKNAERLLGAEKDISRKTEGEQDST